MSMAAMSGPRHRGGRKLAALGCAAVLTVGTAVAASAQEDTDPRVGLRGGWKDAASAARGMALIAHRDRPPGFFDPNALGNLMLGNSDMAFRGELLFLGSFQGFQVWDIADPAAPRLRTAFPCPGGQGDLSVHGDLLFMSVEMPNGRIDCGPGGSLNPAPDPARFLGVRIFDISDVAQPKQVAAVQTCRGSHTHTLVPDASDSTRVFVYVSGTSMVRPAAELAGCAGGADENSALFRIEVIEVPLAAPQEARVVNAPRIFADAVSGDIAGLWRGGAHGAGTQSTARTDQCHDITVFPELGMAAGACSGNGILLDIADPANPVRIAEVVDPNFAYWHSATFNSDGTRVLYTDEWGGGMAAHCRASDPREWGANAIFTIADDTLRLDGYYKLPVPQTATENCVAHNGSLIPVPGRELMVQAWYQGGISVFDFTDPANPFEIAFFDRGPLASGLEVGGFWSAYWYNGHVYGSEIARGLDVFELVPGDQLTQHEIDAARLVRTSTFNPQTQTRPVWPASVVVARALLDQLRRDGLEVGTLGADLDRLEQLGDGAARRDLLDRMVARLAQEAAPARPATGRRLELLAGSLRALSDASR